MAGRKLTELTATEALSNDDLVYAVDIDAAVGSKSKGITKANLAAQMSTSVASSEPVENEYADITALLADQGNQTESFLQYVVDASDDPNIASGEAYYEKLSGSTTTLADDYRLLSDTEVEVVRDSNSYRVFRIQAIQDDGTPLTSVNGGRISFEYSGANVTAILFNKRYTDAIAEFYGKDVNIRFYNRATRKYQTEAVASGAWTTVNTDYYRAAVTGTNIQIADLTVTNRVEFFISEASAGGGSSTITESTGTTITFTADTFYNNLTYLTSGALTLDLTGAVVGTAAWVWCDKYIPTISGENFLLTGIPSVSKLNVYKMVYTGVQTDDYDIDVFVDTKTYLVTPSITITPSDTVNTLSGYTVPNATSYEILSSTTNDIGTASAVSPAYDGTSSTYAHTGLTNGVVHYYWIKAINKLGYLDSSYATASGASAITDFIFDAVASDNFFQLPLVSTGTYNFDIYVDDVLGDTITVWNDANTDIDLGDTASHEIKLVGNITGFSFAGGGDRLKIRDISNWGNVKLGIGDASITQFFDGCSSMTVSATDVCDINTTTMENAFKNADAVTTIPNISDWNWTSVTIGTNCFLDAGLINPDLETADLSNITDFTGFLQNADSWNGTLTNANLASASDCFQMFRLNSGANPDAHTWTNFAPTEIDWMFQGTGWTSKSLANWDVSNVTSGSNFLLNEVMSTSDYDATLISWGSQTVTTAAVHMGNSTYTQTSVDSGTTDGTTASKLVDSTQNFVTTVTIGDIIHNTTDGTFAEVTAIDSDTQLSLDADIMVSGEAYVVQSSAAAKGRYSLISQGWTITDNGSV